MYELIKKEHHRIEKGTVYRNRRRSSLNG
ncbi:MAG: hypothetical protein ACLVBW_15250 [Lachnospiraceae bacterium]